MPSFLPSQCFLCFLLNMMPRRSAIPYHILLRHIFPSGVLERASSYQPAQENGMISCILLLASSKGSIILIRSQTTSPSVEYLFYLMSRISMNTLKCPEGKSRNCATAIPELLYRSSSWLPRQIPSSYENYVVWEMELVSSFPKRCCWFYPTHFSSSQLRNFLHSSTQQQITSIHLETIMRLLDWCTNPFHALSKQLASSFTRYLLDIPHSPPWFSQNPLTKTSTRQNWRVNPPQSCFFFAFVSYLFFAYNFPDFTSLSTKWGFCSTATSHWLPFSLPQHA